MKLFAKEASKGAAIQNRTTRDDYYPIKIRYSDDETNAVHLIRKVQEIAGTRPFVIVETCVFGA
jgi:hypothetical protein